MLCGDAIGSGREAEKSDLSALLSGPTMWLGAQDGRYRLWNTVAVLSSNEVGLLLYSA